LGALQSRAKSFATLRGLITNLIRVTGKARYHPNRAYPAASFQIDDTLLWEGRLEVESQYLFFQAGDLSDGWTILCLALNPRICGRSGHISNFPLISQSARKLETAS
jgi:hypothetical protein